MKNGTWCFHGVRKVWECTNDIDIVLSPDAESAQFLTNALSEIGPLYNFHSNLYADFIALPRKQWKFPDGTFDFRTIDSRKEFLRHLGDAVAFSLDGLDLKIASPVTVQELKQVAIAANQNAEKHQADINKLNALQLSSGSKGDASLYDNRNSSL